VDVISGAGKRTRPPNRAPSIVLDREGPQVVWDPRWRKFALGNYILSGLSLGTALGTLAIPPAETRWTGVSGFDAEIRGALRADELDDRQRARDASDILLMVSVNQVLVDTLLVTWWGHDADTVAFQMAMMNIEALTVNAAINGLVTGLASRERPYRDDCVGEAATELRDCRSSKRYRSFYSGHTSTTFTVAGLTCIHHAYLPLYGGGAADVLPCIASFGVAAATGALRVVGDQHFASDVLVGAAMGTLTGLTLPYFLHYRTGELPDASPDRVSWVFVPTPLGAHLGGTF
jgi:hypothetical protein